MPIGQLNDPPANLLVRSISPWYVQYLKKKMTHGDHEDLTSPLCVVACVPSGSFVPSDVKKYSYAVSVTLWNMCY